MKKILSILLLVVLTYTLCGCAGKSSKVTIDYGESKIYTKKDMDKAIKLLKKEFKKFDDCELHTIKYASDESVNDENLKWVNGKRPQEYIDKDIYFTQVIMFTTNFHTPKHDNCCFTNDIEMEEYQWWFARTDGGEWIFVDAGY